MECQKPLTFCIKKNNLSVSKGCYKESCWSSNLSKIPVSKTEPKTSGSRDDPRQFTTFRRVYPTNLVCVWMWLTTSNIWMGNGFLSPYKALAFFIFFFICRPQLQAAPGPPCGDSAQTNSSLSALTYCQTADKTDHISKHFLRRGHADQTGSHWTAEC